MLQRSLPAPRPFGLAPPGTKTRVNLAFGLAATPERPPPLNNEALRILIAHKLQDGRLPRNSVPRVYGGPGNGETCDACELPITKEQMAIQGIALAQAAEDPCNCTPPVPDLGVGETEARVNAFIRILPRI